MILFVFHSPLHPAHGFDPVFATLASAMGIAGIGYALWMILQPKNYFDMLERRLQRLENQRLITQSERANGKIDALRMFIYAGSPIRKIRIQGYTIILVIVIFEFGVWHELLPSLFGR